MPTPPPFPPPGSLRLKLVRRVMDLNVLLYRWSRGRVAGTVKGAPVLLLDHVGRKTGRTRTTPVLYMESGRDLVVVASRAGSAATPMWWLNLKARPRAAGQVGAER